MINKTKIQNKIKLVVGDEHEEFSFSANTVDDRPWITHRSEKKNCQNDKTVQSSSYRTLLIRSECNAPRMRNSPLDAQNQWIY